MLEFCTYVENKSGLSALPPRLELRIQAYGANGVGPKGQMLITPWLANATEVDWHIDKLIERLEVVRAEAKSQLAENDA